MPLLVFCADCKSAIRETFDGLVAVLSGSGTDGGGGGAGGATGGAGGGAGGRTRGLAGVGGGVEVSLGAGELSLERKCCLFNI